MEESEKKVKPINRAKVHITGTMCLCFAFEFCVRWTTNAYESRYGIYLSAGVLVHLLHWLHP